MDIWQIMYEKANQRAEELSQEARWLSRSLDERRMWEWEMDNKIDVSIPVAQVIDQHPEVLDLLVELGFKPLANPIMRNTVGRKVSLKQGSKLEGTPMDKIVRTLEANGYEVVGLDQWVMNEFMSWETSY